MPRRSVAATRAAAAAANILFLKIGNGCRKLILFCIRQEPESFPANCLVRIGDERYRLREERAVRWRRADQRGVQGVESRVSHGMAEEEINLVEDLSCLSPELRHDERAALHRIAVVAVNQAAEVLCRVAAQNLPEQIVGGLSFLAGKILSGEQHVNKFISAA